FEVAIDAEGPPRELGITGNPFGKAIDRVFGCSFTYGWLVNDAETYPYLLQAALPEYRIVNFAVPGYGNVQSLLQFKRALATHANKPALALFTYGFFMTREILLTARRPKTPCPGPGWVPGLFRTRGSSKMESSFIAAISPYTRPGL